MASQQESLKMLRFATTCILSEYYSSVNDQSAPSRHHGNQLSLLLVFGGEKKHHSCCHGDETLISNKSFVSCFGCISNILQNLQHFS